MYGLGNASASTARTHQGAYSVGHSASLRIISINTMFYEAENLWLYNTTMAYGPSSQFGWLINELQEAKDVKQRVYVIGHIPFGRPDAFKGCTTTRPTSTKLFNAMRGR